MYFFFFNRRNKISTQYKPVSNVYEIEIKIFPNILSQNKPTFIQLIPNELFIIRFQ